MSLQRTSLSLCFVLATFCSLQPGLAEDGVNIAWGPSQKCDDTPGSGNCVLCNEFALQCLECLPGYGFNSRGQCQACTNGNLRLCLTCDLTSKLAKCLRCLGVPTSDAPYSQANPGYPTYRDKDGNCQKCSRVDNPGCLTCDTAGRKCTKCNDGYFRMPNGDCVACLSENCKRCNSTGHCLECASSDRGPSFGLTAQGTCKQCRSEGCVRCNADWRKCERCMDGIASLGERGYGSDGHGSCKPCATALCAKCHRDYRKCTACVVDPYGEVFPYLTPAGQCKPCKIAGCKACSTTGKTCSTCAAGYIRNSKKLCEKLPECAVANCYDCRGKTQSGCNTCVSNYFLAQPNQCKQCMEKCQVCGPDKYKCKKCFPNWGLVGSKCIRCETQDAEYSYCERCDGNLKKCTLCWPADKFRPDPKTGSCVRYRLPDTLHT